MNSSAAQVAGRRPRYADALAIREFRYVYAAHLLSMLGTIVAQVALSVLVYERTSSPGLSALTFALGFIPYALGGSVLSSVADRFPPRGTLVACDLASAMVVAAMAVPQVPVAALLSLLLVEGTIAPVFAGTRAATLPDILPGELYVVGRSLMRIVAQGTQVIGFGLGGLLLVVVSPRIALALDAASFVVSAGLLRLGTCARPARDSAGTRRVRDLARDSLAGVRDILSMPRVRALLLLGWLPPGFAVVPEGLAVAYASGLGQGTGGAGLLLAAGPIGLVASEALAVRLLSQAMRIRLVLPLQLCVFLPLLAFAVGPRLAPAAVLLALAGAGHASALGLDQLFLDAVPEQMRGRAFSVSTAGLMLIQGLGFALGGGVAELLGPQATIVAAGVAGIATVAALGRLLHARAVAA